MSGLRTHPALQDCTHQYSCHTSTFCWTLLDSRPKIRNLNHKNRHFPSPLVALEPPFFCQGSCCSLWCWALSPPAAAHGRGEGLVATGHLRSCNRVGEVINTPSKPKRHGSFITTLAPERAPYVPPLWPNMAVLSSILMIAHVKVRNPLKGHEWSSRWYIAASSEWA